MIVWHTVATAAAIPAATGVFLENFLQNLNTYPAMTPNKIRGSKAMTKLKKLPEIPPTVIKGEKTKLVIPGAIVALIMDVKPNTNPRKAPAAGPIVLARIITGTCINVILRALTRKYPIGVKHMMISMAKNKAMTLIWRIDSFDLFIFSSYFRFFKRIRCNISN